jgi:hypothetical protein
MRLIGLTALRRALAFGPLTLPSPLGGEGRVRGRLAVKR